MTTHPYSMTCLMFMLCLLAFFEHFHCSFSKKKQKKKSSGRKQTVKSLKPISMGEGQSLNIEGGENEFVSSESQTTASNNLVSNPENAEFIEEMFEKSKENSFNETAKKDGKASLNTENMQNLQSLNQAEIFSLGFLHISDTVPESSYSVPGVHGNEELKNESDLHNSANPDEIFGLPHKDSKSNLVSILQAFNNCISLTDFMRTRKLVCKNTIFMKVIKH